MFFYGARRTGGDAITTDFAQLRSLPLFELTNVWHVAIGDIIFFSSTHISYTKNIKAEFCFSKKTSASGVFSFCGISFQTPYLGSHDYAL